MTVFSDGIDAIYRDPNMGVPADYYAAGGDLKAVRLLPRQPGEAEVAFRSGAFATGSGGGHLWSIRASDLQPVKGDRFVVDGRTYEVQGAPELLGAERLEWNFEAREVTV